MRTLAAGLLFLVAWAAHAAAGQEDPVTALVPKESPIVLRLPSLDRIDALANEFQPLIANFMGRGERGRLERAPVSTLLMEEFGFTTELPFVRDRPVYLALVEDEPVLYLPAEDGAPAGLRELLRHRVAILREGMFCIGKRKEVEAPLRGRAVALLPGDATVHVFLSEVVERHRAEIDAFFKEMEETSDNERTPRAARAFLKAALGVSRDAVYGVAAAEYAVTWDGTRLLAEGFVRTQPGSRLRGFFGRAGAPGANDLAAFLPRDPFFIMDTTGTANWISEELASLLSTFLGPGAGAAAKQILGSGYLPADHFTGRSASAVTLSGMGGSSQMVMELKDGARSRDLLKAFDPAPLNQALKEADIPFSVEFQPAVAVHEGVEIHELKIKVEDPDLAMLGMMLPETLIAVQGSFLAAAQSPTAETDLEDLLDRIRAGPGKELHPHVEAMGRLGAARHFGLTFNLGGIKPLGFVFGMADPAAVQVVAGIPDELYLSSSVAIQEGHLHWRGDWPLKDLAKIAEAVFVLEREARLERAQPPVRVPVPPAR